MTKSLKLAHPGTNTDFYKKFGENYFTRKKYKKKVEQYKNLNKNKNSFDWIYNYFITPFNEAKEGEQ